MPLTHTRFNQQAKVKSRGWWVKVGTLIAAVCLISWFGIQFGLNWVSNHSQLDTSQSRNLTVNESAHQATFSIGDTKNQEISRQSRLDSEQVVWSPKHLYQAKWTSNRLDVYTANGKIYYQSKKYRDFTQSPIIIWKSEKKVNLHFKSSSPDIQQKDVTINIESNQ